MEGPRPQRLLGCPQGIPPPRGPDHGQALKAHSCGPESGRIGQMRGSQPGHPVPLPSQRGKRRQDELQLPYPLLAAKDLDQPPGRPAPAGELGIERLEAGRHRHCAWRSGSATAPDGLPLEKACQGVHDTVFIYSISLFGKPPVSAPAAPDHLRCRASHRSNISS